MAEGIRHAALCALLSYLSVMYSLPRAELRRFLQARPENADRSNECTHAGALDLSRVAAEARVAIVVGDCRFPAAEQAAPRARKHLAHQCLRFERVPETVVVHNAGCICPWRQHGFQRPFE